MNCLSMHVLSGLWIGNNEFGMTLVWNMNEWLVINVGMELVCMIILCWLVRRGVGMVRT